MVPHRLYRSKPTYVEAAQWFKDGDHPAVVLHKSMGGQSYLSDRYAVNGKQGWALVNPGDWIIREPLGGGHYPCAPDVFACRYEEAVPDDGEIGAGLMARDPDVSDYKPTSR